MTIVFILLLTLGAWAAPGDLEFHQAVRNGQWAQVEALLAQGYDPLRPDQNGDTPAHAAANGGQVELLEKMLDLGIDPNAANRQGRTLLCEAAVANSAPCCRLLLKRGAKLESPGPAWPPFRAALIWGKAEAALVLLEAGADPQTTFDDGETALMTAAGRGPIRVVEALLAGGAELSSLDDEGYTALHHAARGGNPDIVSLLMGKGLDPLEPSRSGKTPLTRAYESKSIQTVERLLPECDPDVALPTVLSWGTPAQAEALLKLRANPQWQDEEGRSSLVLVAGRSQHAIELTHLLLGSGAVLDPETATAALQAACRGENPDLAEFLLQQGADPNTPDPRGYYPLLTACDLGNLELLKSLLKAGADPSVRGPGQKNGIELVEDRIVALEETLKQLARYRCLHPEEASARSRLQQLLAARPQIRDLLAKDSP